MPVEYRGPGLEITVDGQINGKPATMLVDTGAGFISVSRTTAEALQLKRRESSAYAIGVGGRSNMYEAYLDAFSIGATRPAKGWARVLVDTGEKPAYDAIAGVPFLMQMDLEVALADKELKFFQAKECDDAFLAYWDRHAVVIPYRRYDAPWPVFSIEINGHLMTTIIDTGATASAITASAARKYRLATSKPDAKELSYTSGVGTRQVPTWITHTQSIKIGNETILDADITVIDDHGDSDFDVILGTDFSEEFNARGGNDTVRARGGDDRLLEGNAASGNDLYALGDGEDLGITFSGRDIVLGGADGDYLILENPAAMDVNGGDGDDSISRYAVPRGQTVNGGAGNNALSIILHDSPGPQAELDIPAGTVTVDGVSSGVSGFRSWNFVSYRPLLVHGSDLGESVRANGWGSTSETPLTAYMGGGDDTVEGGASDDYVDGGDGTDTANLGDGTNTCVAVEHGDC